MIPIEDPLEDPEENILPNHFPAIIFDATDLLSEVPAGFDAVRIHLDGSLKADLSWQEASHAAKNYTAKGLKIFWDLDLQLFDRLNYPIDNESQFLSFKLSIQHFQNTLWEKFRNHTLALCLYRGQIPANIDIAGDYLNLLAGAIPDSLPCFALFDGSHLTNPFILAQHLSKERFPKMTIGVKGSRGLSGELGWDDEILSKGILTSIFPKNKMRNNRSIAVCLPLLKTQKDLDMSPLEKAMIQLEASKVSFRVIPECLLMSEWDGLDELIVQSNALSKDGARMLKGFCAAGGIVIYVGVPLGLCEEIPFENYL